MKENQRVLTGYPVSQGVAKAEAYHYEPLMLNIEAGYFKAGKETEYWRAFMAAREKTEQELQSLEKELSTDNEKSASIFAAHLTILKDEDLLYEIKSAILNDRMYPEQAVEACTGEVIASMKNIKDAMAERYIADILDVKNRLLCNYFGKSDRTLTHLEKDVIVVVEDLLPSDVATIDRTHIKGIITEKGETNSHAIILARSYEIPMITGVTDAMKMIPDGELLEIDGETGKIVFNNRY